jgi:hypothetical protein
MFVIEDEWHAEWLGEYLSRDDALDALQKLANLPWNEPPNVCPCTSWRTCGRRYRLIEFDGSAELWRKLGAQPVLEISATGTKWITAPKAVKTK